MRRLRRRILLDNARSLAPALDGYSHRRMTSNHDAPPVLKPGDQFRDARTPASGWTVPHVQHQRTVRRLHKTMRESLVRIAKLGRYSSNDDVRAGKAIGEMLRRGEEVHGIADSIVILVAMTVEAFTNLYGVVALGEAYYTQHLSRLSAATKVAVLILSCEGVLLAKDAEVISLARRIHGRRNALVHPKPQELTEDDASAANRESEELTAAAEQSIVDMDRYIMLLCEYAPRMRPFARRAV